MTCCCVFLCRCAHDVTCGAACTLTTGYFCYSQDSMKIFKVKRCYKEIHYNHLKAGARNLFYAFSIFVETVFTAVNQMFDPAVSC